MESLLKEQEELKNKINSLKNELINLHIDTETSISSTDIIKDIYKMEEVTSDLKELLILLHTNNVTITKQTRESLVVTYNEVLTLTSEAIDKQNALINKLIEKERDETKQKSFKQRVIHSLSSPLVVIPVAFVVVLAFGAILIHFLPKETGQLMYTIRKGG